MIEPDYASCWCLRHEDDKGHQRRVCGSFRLAYVYGLYDARVGDIFYVGSTVQAPGKRFSGHMQPSSWEGTTRGYWMRAILDDGSFPLFFPLCELATECEDIVRSTERAIALELRALGHTAICDGKGLSFMSLSLTNVYGYAANDKERDELHMQVDRLREEHLARVNEQARILRWLREL